MRKLWDRIMNNKLLTLSILFFFGTVIFAQGCASNIKATIHLPNGEIATFYGPQKSKMLLEENGRKVEYSGLSDPWWKGLLGIFGGAVSSKIRSDAETNINLNP